MAEQTAALRTEEEARRDIEAAKAMFTDFNRMFERTFLKEDCNAPVPDTSKD